ncbi:MAG: DEAD/DEAH box helicase, partial [Treponema sp.]|nr:DEAD/DEAH box helicase [Treponema sp.]
MFLRELGEPVSRLRGAGSATAGVLARAGINTVSDLLCRYPRDYEDRSRLIPLAQFAKHPQVCTTVTVLSHEWIGFGGMRTLKVYVEDESARAVLVCWNRNFLEKQLAVGERYRLWGRFHYKYGEIQSSAFEVSPAGPAAGEGAGPGPEADPGAEAGGTGRGGILPVYPLSAGLNQGLIRRLVKRALDAYAPSLDEELPEALIKREGLLPKARAIRNIHFPAAMEDLDRARKTLIWGELFYLELIIGKRAMERKSGAGREQAAPKRPQPASAQPLAGTSRLSALQRRLTERLPFELTPGQKEAIGDINRDMEGPWPMARLLQGDVGSGKTLVSFLAALGAADSGGQAAIMAPTELLARQHAENAARLLEPLGLRLSFLTGNIKAAGRKELLKNLAAGEIDLVLGTHALFSEDVVYRDLRLVVVDEQHRFGVSQRGLIMAKGNTPDLLMMSATPIPRSLALTIFGD